MRVNATTAVEAAGHVGYLRITNERQAQNLIRGRWPSSQHMSGAYSSEEKGIEFDPSTGRWWNLVTSDNGSTVRNTLDGRAHGTYEVKLGRTPASLQLRSAVGKESL